MTLEKNVLVRKMHNIYYRFCWTLQCHHTLVRDPLHRNPSAMGLSTPQGPPIHARLHKKRLSPSSDIKLVNLKTNCFHIQWSNMVPRSNMPKQPLLHHIWTRKVKGSFNKCGEFLFWDQAVNSPLLVPISTIAAQSMAPTEDTMSHTKQLLEYVAMQEEVF